VSAAVIVGHRVAQARAALGFTLRAVADRVGVSVPFVHDGPTLEAVAAKFAIEGIDREIVRRLRSLAKAGVL
jgi:transcriptional regulator with XRE-family HTH domain